MSIRILDLSTGSPDHIEQATALLCETFRDRTDEWPDLDAARRETLDSLAPGKISRIAVDPAGAVLGWIGGMPMYGGRVWELHPLVVAAEHRRLGIGRALVADLERLVAARGGITIWLGSDDENDETSLSGVDLYTDIPAAIRGFRKLRGEHPCDFYLRLGFTIVGVLPDANGPGKPDIYFARRIAPASGQDRRSPSRSAPSASVRPQRPRAGSEPGSRPTVTLAVQYLIGVERADRHADVGRDEAGKLQLQVARAGDPQE